MVTESADPQLRDVTGPSALSGGWKRFWELTLLLASTEFKRTYFGTALGYVWSVARPLMLFLVLVEVFTHVIRLGNQVPHYAEFLLFNMVLFGFFTEATTIAVSSIVSQEGIVRKTQFPRLAIPMAVVMTALFNLLLNLVVVFVFILVAGISPTWTWLLLPVLVLLMTVITLAVSMIVSSLYPRFRDLGIIWSVFVTALFYATPVLYPLEIAVSSLAYPREAGVAEPVHPDPRAGAPVDHRSPTRRIPGPQRAAGRCNCWSPSRSASSPACSRCGCSDARRLGSPKSCRWRLGRGDQRPAEHHRDQRHRRHLPVPVERSVGDVGDEAGDRSGGKRRYRAVSRPSREPEPAEKRRQQRHADQPQLGQRLQRQRVGVLGELGDRPVAQPVHRPAARADPAAARRRKPASPPASSRSDCSAGVERVRRRSTAAPIAPWPRPRWPAPARRRSAPARSGGAARQAQFAGDLPRANHERAAPAAAAATRQQRRARSRPAARGAQRSVQRGVTACNGAAATALRARRRHSATAPDRSCSRPVQRRPA